MTNLTTQLSPILPLSVLFFLSLSLRRITVSMAVLEAATLHIFSDHSSFSKSSVSRRISPSIKLLRFSNSTPSLSCNFPLLSLGNTTRKLSFQIYSTVEETIVETKTEETQKQNVRRKLFVFNLPWSLSVAEIKNLFGQCGTVADVEFIKHKDGKSRNFAFVTMASPEAALAAVNQMDTQEVSGRIIRVEFAKKFKKPRPSRSENPPRSPARETQHKLYVSNLAWKVRSSHLKEMFSSNFNPVSAKVVFESNQGRSAGYGFVSFATKEEAEAAISSLDGKELMGRPLCLKLSQRNNASESNDEEDNAPESSKEEEDVSEDQPAES